MAAVLACTTCIAGTSLLAACAAGPESTPQDAKAAPGVAAAVDPAPASRPGTDVAPDGWRRAVCADGVHTVAWRPVDGPDVPRNRAFDVEVLVTAHGAPRAVDHFALSGWMPDHNHGLVRIPAVRAVGEGRWRVDGLLLHMRGRWQLHVSFVDGGELETVPFDLEL